jgi:hypothetical protein
MRAVAVFFAQPQLPLPLWQERQQTIQHFWLYVLLQMR